LRIQKYGFKTIIVNENNGLSDIKTPSFLKRGAEVPINCQVHIPDFEGPLDLLLHLIRNHELDIVNLPIAKITGQYLAYLDYMRELNLDLASEYLVMAATLTYLKSQVILPQEISPEKTGPDPKAQLIRRLIELKGYKDLARELANRPRLFRDVFLCRNTGADEIQDGLEAEVALSNPFQISEAFLQLLERRKTIVHKVVNDEVPIAHCISQLVEHLKTRESIRFAELLPTVVRPQDAISMFLGVLEMARMQMSTIEQDEIFAPIRVVRSVDPQHLDRANDLIKGLSWT
jgi:segregation and condensation protein A